MTQSKGLQKLTDLKALLHSLEADEQLTTKHIEQLTSEELQQLNIELTKKVDSLDGEVKDYFLHLIEPILSEETRNQIWENNHAQIIWAMTALIEEKGRPPSKSEIAAKTELSRQTVHKHLNEFKQHPQHIEQMKQFQFLGNTLLAKVYDFAMKGDMSAAKLYFNVIGLLNKSNSTIRNQNNFIQINGTILSQEAIKELNPEQLEMIEIFLKKALSTK